MLLVNFYFYIVATISFANATSATVNEGEAFVLDVQMTGPLTTQVTAT